MQCCKAVAYPCRSSGKRVPDSCVVINLSSELALLDTDRLGRLYRLFGQRPALA